MSTRDAIKRADAAKKAESAKAEPQKTVRPATSGSGTTSRVAKKATPAKKAPAIKTAPRAEWSKGNSPEGERKPSGKRPPADVTFTPSKWMEDSDFEPRFRMNGRGSGVLKGYVNRWPRRDTDLWVATEAAKETDPNWWVVCNIHYSRYGVEAMHEAGDTPEADRWAHKRERTGKNGWCEGCRVNGHGAAERAEQRKENGNGQKNGNGNGNGAKVTPIKKATAPLTPSERAAREARLAARRSRKSTNK